MEQLGPYRLQHLLARGGMGEVYLARLSREAGFEKEVAIKRLLPQLCGEPTFVEMFEREARLAAGLNHRHIVQIHDFGRAGDGTLWLAMEHVDGVHLGSVLDVCRQQGTLLPRELAVEIGLACCQALEYAHRGHGGGRSAGLVHRDVSPQNILLSYAGDIKLTDFGLAHIPEQEDREPELLKGKIAYMSPEQAEGLPLDARSDLFSLGVVLYEAFSGQRTFLGRDGSAATWRRVRAAEPLQPLEQAAPDLPLPLVAVVRQALSRSRADRFADAAAFHDALLDAATRCEIRPGARALGPWLVQTFARRKVGEALATALETTAAAEAPIATPAPPPPSPRPAFQQRRLRRGATLFGAAALLGTALILGLPLALGPPEAPGPGQVRPTVGGSISPVRPAAERVQPAAGSAELPVLAARPGVRGDATLPGSTGPLSRPPDSPSRPLSSPDTRTERAGHSPSGPRARPGSPGVVVQPPVPPPALETGATSAAPPPGHNETPSPGPAAPDPGVPAGPAAGPAAPENARVRLAAPGRSIDLEGHPGEGWHDLQARGLLFAVAGGSGPPVRLRLSQRGMLVRANLDSQPWGRVSLDGRLLGETPLAGIPLRSGVRRLEVAGPRGETTELLLEIVAEQGL